MPWERELFRLAGWYLACNLQVMGGLAVGCGHKPNLPFDLLGLVDYGNEMRMMLAEVRVHGGES